MFAHSLCYFHWLFLISMIAGLITIWEMHCVYGTATNQLITRSSCHMVMSSHGHVVTRSTRRKSTRHRHVFFAESSHYMVKSSHSLLITSEHCTKLRVGHAKLCRWGGWSRQWPCSFIWAMAIFQDGLWRPQKLGLGAWGTCGLMGAIRSQSTHHTVNSSHPKIA